MTPRNEPATLVAEQELVITRRFDAPGHRGGWSSSFDRLDEALAKA